MKKNGNKYHVFRNNVYLYRKDLIEIESTLKEVSDNKLEIKFDDFESQSISDIPEKQKATSEISFSVYNPHISFRIGRYDSTFYLSEDKLELRGLVEKVKDILKKNSPFKLILARKILAYLEGGISVLIIMIFFLLVIDNDPIIFLKDNFFVSRSQSTLLIVLFILCFVGSIQLILPAKSYINFCYKDTKPTFWKRNKDAIIITIVGGVIVGLILHLL
jgi:hypothetical protein